jgi:hypothetical protein
MFESLNKVGSIESLEEKIKSLGSNKTSYWLKLSESCSKMSADQLNYVSNDEAVINAKSKMMDAFSLFLFEKYKEDFASTEMFVKYCDDYIDTINDVSKNYTDSIIKTLDENKELKAKILKLEKELNNAKSNAKGA